MSERRLTVAVIINTYDELGTMSGGIVHILEAARRWRGFDVTVFAPETARRAVEGALRDAVFVPMPSPEHTRSIALLFLARTAASIFVVNRLRRFDAIYTISPFLPDIVPAVLAAPKRTVAQAFHLQKPPGQRPGNLLRNMLAYANEGLGMWLLRRFVRRVVVLNDVSTPSMKLPRGTQVYRVGAGAWPESVRWAVKPILRRSGAVTVGRIAPTKGLNDLIEAWSLVSRALPDAKLTLVGGGDRGYVEMLRNDVRRRGLSGSIDFAGAVSNERKIELVSSARIFVSASREEGWGIAIAEAMALGIPCVTYDLAVFDEAFPTGRVGVPLGDTSALATAVERLLRDQVQYERLAAEALELGSQFSWETVARIEEEAIRSCVA